MSLSLTASPDQLRQNFLNLQSPQDIAALLDVDYSRLVYHLHKTPSSVRYSKFQIPKKGGGYRNISAPATALKIIQIKLSQVLNCVYEPKPSVHGFVPDRSIVTNADPHIKQKYVLNVDLKDFFPSINFGRVRGMFMGKPYNLNPAVATVLAQISCFDNQLPQGAPTSPTISNMICAKMDSQLMQLAKKHRCVYTRYADDITFSTSMPRFPVGLATMSEKTGQLEVGEELDQIIRSNGFVVNARKVRLQTKFRRQEVTGLTTNKFLNVERRYIRQVRAMLHAWRKFGLDAAENEFHVRYDKKHRLPEKGQPSFKQVVKGKIEFLRMVKGEQDLVYLRFAQQLAELAPEFQIDSESPGAQNLASIFVATEGKTDWKHLKSALQKFQSVGRFTDLKIEFWEFEDKPPMGDVELLAHCRLWSHELQPRIKIAIFDNDVPKTTKEASGENGQYKNWTNNIFSFVIPVPDHRQETAVVDVCMEMYYRDADITRKDKADRRLYLSNEFNSTSGNHLDIDGIHCMDRNRIKRLFCIIDNEVFDKDDKNIALPKSDFANFVLNQEDGFSDLDISEFAKIFEIISSIAKENKVIPA